jgi:Cytotoxic
LNEKQESVDAVAGTPRVSRPFPSGDTLPGFPDAQKARAKTPRAGGGRRSRWKTEDGTIIERDYLHDTVEVYDASGRRHLGEFDPWDGRQINAPDVTRSVEP